MTFLPIVGRELRVASRRRSTYWTRARAAFSVLLLGTWFFLIMHRQPAQEIAQALFHIFSGSCLFYGLLSGIRYTADCLSEEKREGTLGLLFLTDLKGYDVVLGKLFANSLNAFYAVLAVLPLLALPLLMGGVTVGEYARTALVAVNGLFLSLSIGICVSALSRSGRKAMWATLLIICFFTAVLPALGAWMAHVSKAKRESLIWLISSPGFTYYLAFDTLFKTQAPVFKASLLLTHLMGWFFLVVASLAAPRVWQDRPNGAQALRWREQWHLWSFGDLAERVAFRRQLLDQNAFFWLSARARLKPIYVWAALGLLACIWAWGVLKARSDWLKQTMYVLTGLVLNILIKVWFASEAGRQLAEARQQGALELLLSTPLSVHDIVRGQALALQRQFLWPIMVTLLCDLGFLAATLSDNVVDTDHGFWIALWGGGMAMLVFDLIALFWVGMWQGLVAKNPGRAAGTTMARILVLPWLIVAVVTLLLSLSSNTLPEPTWKVFLGCWFLTGIGIDAWIGGLARRRLLTEFRRVAEQRYTSGPGFWKRLLGAHNTKQIADHVRLAHSPP